MSKWIATATLVLGLLCPSSGAAAQPAIAVDAEPVLIGQTYTLRSKVLGTDRRLSLRLPTGYAEAPQTRYPVVYVIDGGPEQDFPHIAGIAQSSEVSGTFAPVIVVGVETVKRRQEITPPVTDSAAYEAELGAVPGGSASFRRFLAEEVKPWVESRYRTSGQDAVMGESLAGLFVVETLFEAPQLFDDYIAVSPSLWWENMKYGREAARYLAALPSGKRRLYVTLADEGYLHKEGVDRLIAALKARSPKELSWLYIDRAAKETHASIYHVAALDAFRAFYGTPSRIYLPGPLLAGKPVRARTAIEEARRARECARETARLTTPEATQTGHDSISYECVLYDYGDRPTAGNFTR